MHQTQLFTSKRHLVLAQLAKLLSQCESQEEKLAVFAKHKWTLPKWLDRDVWRKEQQVVLLALCATEQLENLQLDCASKECLDQLVDNLLKVEQFYGFMGGLVGYHAKCLDLSQEKLEKKPKGIYHKPSAYDISQDTLENRLLRLVTLRNLDQIAEMYPVGGAADRLSCRLSKIAANRMFCEKFFLEHLIDDVKAKEVLAKRCFDLDVTIPIVLMTSDEKDGTHQIHRLLEQQKWFGRDPDSFFFVNQPLVPAMTPEGKWIATSPGHLLLKPGGHGVFWKVCEDQGAFEWLKGKGKSKVFIRQINNLIAGVDDGLYTFIGYGFDQKKDFGFASCPRDSCASEGVDVVIETEKGFTLTNIEYCDFEHYRVDPEADLLANTNLLFADIKTVQELVEKNPIPGLLVNPKKSATSSGNREMIMRLESTMQNLADGLISPSLPVRAYITTNKRQKTISPIKREGESHWVISQTPEQCLIDMRKNALELLRRCEVAVEEGVLFEYDPCLGPFYDIISQKLRGGELKKHSHLQLHLSEIDIEGLMLHGALTIESQLLGSAKWEGRCQLNSVKVVNRGLNRGQIPSLASSPRTDHQRCRILIERGGEFHASNVTLKGDLTIRVLPFTKVVAFMEKDRLKLTQETITKPSWQWEYKIDEMAQIHLQKNEKEFSAFL